MTVSKSSWCRAAVAYLLATAALSAAAAAGDRAAATRPSSSSGSGGGSVSSGSGSSGGGRSTVSSDSRGSAGPTRPGTTSGGRGVIRDDRRSQHGGGSIHFGFWGYHPWRSSWYWGPWGYGYWGYPYGYVHPVYPVGYASAPSYGMGALDLNVRPKDAEVHVNGQYVGLVRQYDGFPGYLWLERGTYRVAFYRPGHQTVEREFEIFTGLVLDVAIDLPPGQAVLPAGRQVDSAPAAPLPPEARLEYPTREAPAVETATVTLEVLPLEASVYLDGRFVGTGEELSRLHDGLIAEPGAHVLEVVAPGRVPETVHFELAPGEAASIEVRLDPAVDA